MFIEGKGVVTKTGFDSARRVFNGLFVRVAQPPISKTRGQKS